MEPKIIKTAKAVALNVQGSYADALEGVPGRDGRPAPSIGYQCPVYAPGMGPVAGPDQTVDVGGPSRIKV